MVNKMDKNRWSKPQVKELKVLATTEGGAMAMNFGAPPGGHPGWHPGWHPWHPGWPGRPPGGGFCGS